MSGGIHDLFTAAAQHHQSGQLAEAEALYRQILELDPRHVEGLHNLGVLAHQTGRYAMAEDLIGRAVALNDGVAHFHQSLANTLRVQGKLEKCAASCQRAIALKSDFVNAHYTLALALSGLGRRDDAVASFRRAIALKPDFADAHYNLALALRDGGKPDDAASSFRRAIALKPGLAEAHCYLGAILLGQDELDQAATCFRRAIELKPGLADAHYNLGLACAAMGRADDAAGSYRRAIAVNPDFADAHNNLGNLLTSQGSVAEGISSIRRAIALKPSLAEAHTNLGVALKKLGELDEAASSIRRAIALQPAFAQAHRALSAVLMLQGQAADARASAILAIELEPDRAESWVELGDVHRTLGEMDMARAAFLRALELDPHCGDAVLYLTGLPSTDGQSPEDRAVREHGSRLAAELDHMPPAKRVPVLFAMSKLLEDQGDYDGAFASMARANAMVRADLSFDIAEVERRLEAVAEVFDRPLLERLKNSGCGSSRPIFIVGMPRSGTTLVEQIISAHPQVFGAGELPDLPQTIAASHGRSPYPGWARTMSPADGLALAQTYLDGLPPPHSSQVRVTDKMVTNFEYLGLIHLFLPNARIIHCRRDPRDVCLSCFASRFTQGAPFAFDLVELGRYWRAYDRLMAHWRAVLPPGRMLEVPYEDVVEDVETWARRLIAHCGLDWDDACLRFYESGRAVHTASVAQVRRPIYASSVGRWRPFARHLGPLLEALGEPWAEDGRVIAPRNDD